MSMSSSFPLLVVASSAIPGLLIFALPEDRRLVRSALNMVGALTKLVFVAFMLLGVARGQTYVFSFPLLPDFDLVLQADALALLFATLSAVLWLVTTVYAIAYLEDTPHRSRFFGFFSLCVSATTGIAFAGNPLTFLIFYEALTISTYPLVIHEGTPAALAAGRRYLAFTLSGGALLLLATVWLHELVGPLGFTPGGAISSSAGLERELILVFALFIAGLGVKTALAPLHAWLPAAMIAPAPVSALLHAVAVVKAGAFGIIRLIYEVYGIELSHDLGVLMPLSIVASITIVYGSFRALTQYGIKKRLAYSTVSQLSYIVLGASIPGPVATVGALVHLVHQGVMKITLFFCAGNFAKTLDVHDVRALDGIGRRMPATTAAFTVAALGMIGLPPMAGFVTKWHLGLGAVRSDQPWVLAIIVVSTLLNAAYFMPLVHAAWFRPRTQPWGRSATARQDAARWLVVPPLVTATLTLLLGLLAATSFSPLAWAEIIVLREYGS